MYLVALTAICLTILAYHYMGYPLFLALLSKVRKRPVTQGDITPPVSLVVLAYNEDAVISDKIRNCLLLDYPQDRLEIIVVTDGSEDSTPEIVRSYKGERVFLLHDPDRRGKSAAINRGVEEASGDILVFSDANAFYSVDALRKLIRNFNDLKVGAVSGRKTILGTQVAITRSEGLYWWYESIVKYMESNLSSTVGVVGEMMAIRRSLFTPIPTNVINDDAFMMQKVLRQDYRVIYEPEAVCWEVSAQSMEAEILRRQRINAGRFQLLLRVRLWPWNQPFVLFQLISHKFLRLFLPLFMIGALLGNGAAVVFLATPNLMRWLFVAQSAFYGLALLGWTGERLGRQWRVPMLAYYITGNSLTSVQGFLQYICGKQTVMWEKARTKHGETVSIQREPL